MAPAAHFGLLASYPLLSAHPCVLLTLDGVMVDCTQSFHALLGESGNVHSDKAAVASQSLHPWPADGNNTMDTVNNCLWTDAQAQPGAAPHNLLSGIQDGVMNFIRTLGTPQPALCQSSGVMSFPIVCSAGSSTPMRFVLFSVTNRHSHALRMLFGIVAPLQIDPSPSSHLPSIGPSGFDSKAGQAEIARECGELLDSDQQGYLGAMLSGVGAHPSSVAPCAASLSRPLHPHAHSLPPSSASGLVLPQPISVFRMGTHPQAPALLTRSRTMRASMSHQNLLCMHAGHSESASGSSSAALSHAEQQHDRDVIMHAQPPHSTNFRGLSPVPQRIAHHEPQQGSLAAPLMHCTHTLQPAHGTPQQQPSTPHEMRPHMPPHHTTSLPHLPSHSGSVPPSSLLHVSSPLFAPPFLRSHPPPMDHPLRSPLPLVFDDSNLTPFNPELVGSSSGEMAPHHSLAFGSGLGPATASMHRYRTASSALCPSASRSGSGIGSVLGIHGLSPMQLRDGSRLESASGVQSGSVSGSGSGSCSGNQSGPTHSLDSVASVAAIDDDGDRHAQKQPPSETQQQPFSGGAPTDAAAGEHGSTLEFLTGVAPVHNPIANKSIARE